MSARISAFFALNELLDAPAEAVVCGKELVVVLPVDPEPWDDAFVVDEGDVLPTVGVETLVPEGDPVDAAKAFPDTRSPSRTVAMLALPMAMEMAFLGALFI
ncbi:MAG: hypothetical protein ACYCYP_11175 [Leptospirales bacterium]